MRGFMKPGGVPDETRAARVILKDFVTGKLLVCKAPPGNDQGEYIKWNLGTAIELGNSFQNLEWI